MGTKLYDKGLYMGAKNVIIKGLFGEYDCNIDLTKRCNILVGANGLGKTSILKILQFLNKKDYIGLASICFKNIEIEFSPIPVELDNLTEEDFFEQMDMGDVPVFDSSIKISIKYTDLFPPINIIIDRMATFLMDSKFENLSNNPKDLILNQKEILKCFLIDLKKEGLLQIFMANAYFSKEQPQAVYRMFFDSSKKYKRDNVHDYEIAMKKSLDTFAIKSSNYSCFNKSPIISKNSQLNFYQWDFLSQEVILIDLVKDYSLRAFPNVEPFVRIPSICFVNDLKKELKENPFTIDEIKDNLNIVFEKMYNTLANKGSRNDIQIDYNGNINKYTFEKLNSENKIKDLDALDIFINRMTEENIFDINMLISRYFMKTIS